MAKRYRVVEGSGPLSLRQSPDRSSPLFEEWFVWQDREVFTPPPHMKVELALQRGIIELVEKGGQ